MLGVRGYYITTAVSDLSIVILLAYAEGKPL